MLSVQSILDLAFTLGLLASLVCSYGALRRRLPGTVLAPQVLGFAFGGVAVLAMIPRHATAEVIVDIRVVPIVLAGAFLGLRGTLITVAVAAAARLWIGGAGALAGTVSICMAGATGLAWSVTTMRPSRRPGIAFLALGVVASTAHAAAAFLPRNVALGYYTTQAPLLSSFYVILIPVFAALLERQRIDMQREAWERSARAAGCEIEIDTAQTLTLTLAQAEAMGRFRDGATLLALRVRASRFGLSLWGAEVEVAVLRALQSRLGAVLPEGAALHLVSHGDLVVLLERRDDAASVLEAIRREAVAAPFEVPGMAPVRLRLTGRQAAFDSIPRWSEILSVFDGTADATAAAAQAPLPRDAGAIESLFATADRLFEARQAAGAIPREA